MSVQLIADIIIIIFSIDHDFCVVTYLLINVRHEYAEREHRQYGSANDAQYSHGHLQQRSGVGGAKAQGDRHSAVNDHQTFEPQQAPAVGHLGGAGQRLQHTRNYAIYNRGLDNCSGFQWRKFQNSITPRIFSPSLYFYLIFGYCSFFREL